MNEIIKGTRDEVLKKLRRRIEAEGYEISKMTPCSSMVLVTRRKKGGEMWELVSYDLESTKGEEKGVERR